MPTALPTRDQVPAEKTWNAESVFASQEDWEKAFAQLDSSLADFARFEGKLGASAATMLAALQTSDTQGVALGKVTFYASMQSAADAGNQEYAALASRAGGLAARFSAATAFFEPEILAVPAERLEEFITQEPGLGVYRHYFETLALRRGHVRSAEVEAVLAQASEPLRVFGRTADILTDAEMPFRPASSASGEAHEVAQGTISELTRSGDRALRRAAWESYADGYLALKNTLASTLSGSVKAAVFRARTHHYPSPLEASLSRNAIPLSVYDSLLDTFRANLPVWHRYWGVLARALGVDRLHVSDVPAYGVPAPLPRQEQSLNFAQASDMIAAGMAPLGEDYVGPMQKGLREQRWVDYAPSQGKGSGAFSFGSYGTYPFIMMNFDGDIFSLSTLAHELGHSMHSYLTWRTQPPVYGDYSLFVAEVASNFNQALVRAHLLAENPDRAFQLGVLEEAMSNFHRYLFVMPTLARFERDCYERIERGEALTADGMSAKLVELFREGYGDGVEVDEPRLGITWAMFGHLYSPFYVYQYATGISAANALAEDVRAQGAPAAARYKEFLKAGSSLFPLNALKLAGIDMTTPAPVQRAFAVLARTIDQLDALV